MLLNIVDGKIRIHKLWYEMSFHQWGIDMLIQIMH